MYYTVYGLSTFRVFVAYSRLLGLFPVRNIEEQSTFLQMAPTVVLNQIFLRSFALFLLTGVMAEVNYMHRANVNMVLSQRGEDVCSTRVKSFAV
jgi:hypothetical protein